MKTTLNLDDELLHQAKRRAAEQRGTLTSVVEEGLRMVLGRRSEPSYRLDLPTFTGDRPPRVEVADREALYEVLDDRSDG
jgi:hypothetical protein